ncbi:hypothetical protein roselon_03543 [Roseibacterium elongatum DSM 19469]|uniref:DUF2948 domain-containing protein n=1 Tax=Roseicyclus elongatus DSM 19469 TaxID=1294273 RepID=W8S6B4_9RHOB|nr:DUF2948 family protein [Roseibacterium elongatum]AHM05797.1 hypothetical protein roselon_03543 [Roseibacterium elongatum DSM 19469]
MVEDARFEDGADRPVALRALDAGDLEVISSLTQDAVLPVVEMTWDRPRRRFALLLNRFRWEDAGRHSPPERVQSVLAIEDVQRVSSQGIDRADRDIVLSLLAIEWAPAEDGAGRVTLVFAGDGAVALDVEALEVTLRDVTRPYVAPSGKVPGHPE